MTGLFGLFLVGGVIIFSAYRGSSQNAVSVAVWGTLPQQSFTNIIQKTPLYQSKEFNVQYVEKSEEDFDADFIEALASGSGPDLFMLPNEKILKHRNKIFAVPYDVFSERQFKDAFIEGAEIFMAPEGVVAMPLYIDPLVMYWNRDIFKDAKRTQPPKYWDEFYDLAKLISQKDGALNIQKSAVAFGEFGNIVNAKEIIINLAMQAGTPVTMWSQGKVLNVFNHAFNKPVLPAEAALSFYTEFSNPAKPSYSWNRSLPSSTNYFLGGNLGLYFGFGSEIRELQLKNPNLNFDVAPIPTSREGGANISYGSFSGLAITKASKNANAAFSVAYILSGKAGSAAFSDVLRLPSTRRDLLNQKPADAYESVFYDSAIRGKGWLDPGPLESDVIFKNMVESITSGQARMLEAINRASNQISGLLEK